MSSAAGGGAWKMARKFRELEAKMSAEAIARSDTRYRKMETLYLTSIPGMRESIKKGLKTPVEKCGEEPGW